MVSALRTMSRALKRDPSDIPAHPGFIRENLKGFSPAMLKRSEGRWRNTKSLVNAALKHVGLTTDPGSYREPLAPPWAALLAKLDNKKRFGLLRLAQYCTQKGISPSGIDNGVLDEFHAYLKATLMERSPRDLHRLACKTWNKATESVPEWPQRSVNVPDYTNR